MSNRETFYEVMRQHGITRRSFLKFCSLTAAGLGLGPEFAGEIAHALETKPRTPVIWLHGLECTCCTESFIRSGNPLAGDVILSMISLDYDDTLMAAAGHQAEELLAQIVMPLIDVALANVEQDSTDRSVGEIRAIAERWVAGNRGLVDGWLDAARSAG